LYDRYLYRTVYTIAYGQLVRESNPEGYTGLIAISIHLLLLY
jgi:hypothetical protein